MNMKTSWRDEWFKTKTTMELNYIKANGVIYRPQKAGVKHESKTYCNYPVCIIKKLLFGRWRIDYFDEDIRHEKGGSFKFGAEDIPNTRLILYPSGIEEISYFKNHASK